MTADVWEAVIQRWSPLQLLIRNSKTGPVWPTDGWMGISAPALTPPPPPLLCHLHIPDISEAICLGETLCGEAADHSHMDCSYEEWLISGRKRDVVRLTLSNEAG